MSGPHIPHPQTKYIDPVVSQKEFFWALRTPSDYIPGEKEKILRLFGKGMKLLFLDKPQWSVPKLRNFILQFDKDVQKRIVLDRTDTGMEKRLWGRELKNIWEADQLSEGNRSIIHCQNVATLLRQHQKVDFCIVEEELKEAVMELPENVSGRIIVTQDCKKPINIEELASNTLLQGEDVYNRV